MVRLADMILHSFLVLRTEFRPSLADKNSPALPRRAHHVGKSGENLLAVLPDKEALGTCERRRSYLDEISVEVIQVATTIFIATCPRANGLHFTLTSIGSMPFRLRCK